MRRLAALAVAAALAGCAVPNLNTRSENHSCSEMKKCCGCEGMEHCQKNSEGESCCKPDDCKCSQVSSRDTSH